MFMDRDMLLSVLMDADHFPLAFPSPRTRSSNQSVDLHMHPTLKVFLTGQIRDANDDSILYTEATCLFVTSTSNLLRRHSKLNMG